MKGGNNMFIYLATICLIICALIVTGNIAQKHGKIVALRETTTDLRKQNAEYKSILSSYYEIEIVKARCLKCKKDMGKATIMHEATIEGGGGSIQKGFICPECGNVFVDRKEENKLDTL